MFTTLNRSIGNLIGWRVSGRMTDDDYVLIVSQLESLMRRYRRVRVLFELHDFSGWDDGTAWDELVFTREHRRHIERIAIVGQKAWQKWMFRLGGPFVQSDLQYFDDSEIDLAWQWLHEGNEAILSAAATKEQKI